MSQSTKVTKSDKALSFMGVRRTFSRGGTSTFRLSFSNCWRSVFPPRKFCTEQIFVLVSMIILRLCNWIFQWITNFVNYIINIQSYQNTNKITFHNIASCSRAFPLLWNVASTREWDITAQQFWWSWVFAPLRGNIADDAMQMDDKTLYPFYTTKKMSHVTVTFTKKTLCWQQ